MTLAEVGLPLCFPVVQKLSSNALQRTNCTFKRILVLDDNRDLMYVVDVLHVLLYRNNNVCNIPKTQFSKHITPNILLSFHALNRIEVFEATYISQNKHEQFLIK